MCKRGPQSDLTSLTLTMARTHTVGRPSSVRVLYFPAFHPFSPRTRTLTVTVHPGQEAVPFFASIFSTRRHIPVYEAIVSVRYLDKAYSFRLAFRYDPLYLRNQALAEVCPEHVWFGDMIVMRRGNNKSIVSIDGHEPARFAVRRYLMCMGDRLDQADLTDSIPNFIFELDEL